MGLSRHYYSTGPAVFVTSMANDVLVVKGVMVDGIWPKPRKNGDAGRRRRKVVAGRDLGFFNGKLSVFRH